jgi:nucleotide-binding universal stress UspA family protein
MPGITSVRAVAVQLGSILVATDFSPVSEKALRHALVIARHYHSQLYLMHVVSSLEFKLTGADSLPAASDLAGRELRKMEQGLSLNGAISGVAANEVVVGKGEIWEELEKIVAQRSVDMIVIGTHRRSGIAKLVLGSVAEQIFRHASCPVLTVGPNCPMNTQMDRSDSLRPILFPTDFSDDSLRALPYALSFAKEQQTRLVLLHMLSPVPEVQGDRWYTASDVIHIRNAARAEKMNRLHGLVHSADPAIAPLCMAEFGEPAEGILWAARNLRVEGIIMGLKQKSHPRAVSHLPWSTAYKVVCGACAAVLTVRA